MIRLRPARRSSRTCRTPGIWNPLPLFGDVQSRQSAEQHPFDLRLPGTRPRRGPCPRSSWLIPSGANSDHPPASIHRSQAYVTALINAAMKSPDWDSTAIFLKLGRLGRLLRSGGSRRPWTRMATACGCRPWSSPPTPGGVTSTTRLYSSDAYLKFIEDDFLWRPPGPPLRPTAARIPGPTSARTSRSWATGPRTSTSASGPPPAAAAAHQPAHGLADHPGLLHWPGRRPGLHQGALRPARRGRPQESQPPSGG